MALVKFLGEVLFSLLFIGSGINHFKNTQSLSQYARSKGLKFSDLLVYLSGIFLVVAPILIIFNIWQTAMFLSLMVFLLLTAFIFHAYWKEKDPMTKINEQIAFNKEISLVGAILIIYALL
jgi:uncharacterized membrane protein YphA (DoxX/SURF4 family)